MVSAEQHVRSEQGLISIVIPVYNEEQCIEPLADAITKVMARLGTPYEVLMVDDGSTDGTYSRLKSVHSRCPNFRVVRLRRNFGQTAALAAGFDHAKGEVIITMDADLQNDPEDIPALLDKLNEGYDIVSGWRRSRKDRLLTRRIPSAVANWIISLAVGVRLHDFGCSLKAYRKEVIKGIELYGELHRYIPAIASWMGISVAEIPVHHHKRKFGHSKYGLSRTIRVLLDIITIKFLLSYSTRPLQLFGLLGLICFAIGFSLSLWLSVERLFFGIPLANRPLLLLGVLLIFVGLQFISMGLLGEMIMRTYHETQKKKIYAIREVLE